MNRLFALVTAAFVIVGCGKDSHPANPASPAAPVPPATYALTGTVSAKTDTGDVALQGAQIDLFDGESHRTALTDDNGNYSIDTLSAGQFSISAAKDGYVTQTAQLQLANNASMNFELLSAAAASNRFPASR